MPRTPLGMVLGTRVPVHTDGGQVNTATKGGTLAVTLADGAAVLLPGHGAVVVGASIDETVARAIALEDACRVEVEAAQLGAASAAPTRKRQRLLRPPRCPRRSGARCSRSTDL